MKSKICSKNYRYFKVLREIIDRFEFKIFLVKLTICLLCSYGLLKESSIPFTGKANHLFKFFDLFGIGCNSLDNSCGGSIGGKSLEGGSDELSSQSGERFELIELCGSCLSCWSSLTICCSSSAR